MNIFGLHITTKKAHLDYIAKHDAETEALKEEIQELSDDLYTMCEAFPFYMGQKVYEVALKNEQGRYTKTNPSLKYSLINEVVVDEKNYFKLVKRFNKDEVFYEIEEAEEFLKDICK